MENPPENHPYPPVANNNDSQAHPSATNLDGVNNLAFSGNVGDYEALGTLYYDYDYDDDDAFLESFPVGFRFVPTDEQLICCYLIPKIKNEIMPPNRFHQEDVYKLSPEELTACYKSQGEKSWYYFTPRERKYMNGSRPRRSAGDGYWKATGVEKQVHENGVIIGSRKALVYYKGKPPNGDKQPWIMHEYHVSGSSRPVDGKDKMLDDCVLCKIYKKVKKGKNQAQAHAHAQVRSRPQPQQLLNQDQGTEKINSSVSEVGSSSHQAHSFYHPSSGYGVCSTSHEAQSFGLPLDNNYQEAMINGSNYYTPYFFNPNIAQYQFYHQQQQPNDWYINNNNYNVMFPMGCKPFGEDPTNFGLKNNLDNCMMSILLPPGRNGNQPSQQRGENENQLLQQPRGENLEREGFQTS